MPPRDFDAARYAEESAAALGLTIDPAHLPGVIENLKLVHRMAQLVLSFPLAEDDEPAPVFHP